MSLFMRCVNLYIIIIIVPIVIPVNLPTFIYKKQTTILFIEIIIHINIIKNNEISLFHII